MRGETDTDSPASDIFKSLADIEVDPFVAAVFDQIRQYNDLLAEQFVDGEQINEIMNELDAEWSVLLHHPAVVTGVLRFLPEDTEGSDGEPLSDFYEDQEVVFGGVFPVPTDTLYAFSQDDPDAEDLHKYELQLYLAREGITTDGKLVMMKGTVRLDDLVRIEFADMFSAEGARRWLEYYHSDLIDDIDVLLLNPSLEECEMVLRLKDLTADIGGPHRGDQALMHRTMQALNVYTNSLFNFDDEVPYQLAVNGDGWQMNEDDEPVAAYVAGATMAIIERIVWLSADEEPDQVVRPCLLSYLLAEDKDTTASELYVPLRSVQSLHSMRYDYFVGYGEV